MRSSRELLPLALAALAAGAGSAEAPKRDAGTAAPVLRPTLLQRADGGTLAVPLSKMPWEKAASGTTVVPFWGDASHTGFMRLIRLPAGDRSYVHSHPQDKHGLVIEGELSQDPVNVPQDNSRHLGPGGYFGVPAGTVHTTNCWSKTDCVVLYFMPGPLVTNVVGEADGGR